METSVQKKSIVACDAGGASATPCVAIIDDDVGMRTMIATYLTRRGYTVATAADGKSGIELLRTHHPDAVLLDLYMPRISGFDVLQAASSLLSEVPVIVVSGTSDIAEAMKAIKMGASDFLLKPITDLSVLLHTLEKNIERFSLKRKSAAYQQELEETVQQLKEGEIAAGKMQQRMLPDPCMDLCGFHIRGDLLASNYLSGDFYDYFALNETNLIFYLADISGHGVSSALLTVLLKSFTNKCIDNFHKNDDDTILFPGKFLEQLNAELCSEQLGKFLTIFMGRIDIATDTLWYVNGGHFPPPVIVKNDVAEGTNTGGGPVGLFPHVVFKTEQVALTNPFSLFLFSDGILDAMGEVPLRKKMERLQDHIQLGTLERFYDKLRHLDERTDDMSMVTLQRIMP